MDSCQSGHEIEIGDDSMKVKMGWSTVAHFLRDKELYLQIIRDGKEDCLRRVPSEDIRSLDEGGYEKLNPIDDSVVCKFSESEILHISIVDHK